MKYNITNSTLNIILIVVTIYGYLKIDKRFIFLPIVFHIINDILFYKFGYSIFSMREMVITCYSSVVDFAIISIIRD